jgi:hypothetical protein
MFWLENIEQIETGSQTARPMNTAFFIAPSTEGPGRENLI